jgi:hypothetical protein
VEWLSGVVHEGVTWTVLGGVVKKSGEPVHWTCLADSALALTMTAGDDAFTCSVNTLGPSLPHRFVAVTLMALVPAVASPLSTPVAVFNVAQPGNPVALHVIGASPSAVNVYE